MPGEVKGFYEAWKKYGKLHWVDLVQPSIDMARNGFSFGPSAHYAATLARYIPILKADPGHRLAESKFMYNNIDTPRNLCKTFDRVTPVGTRIYTYSL